MRLKDVGYVLWGLAIAAIAFSLWYPPDQPEVIPYQEPLPDPKPRAAYEALAPAIEANRGDVNAAHERIDALGWQMKIVVNTCPGRKHVADPPYPVAEQGTTAPFVAPKWGDL